MSVTESLTRRQFDLLCVAVLACVVPHLTRLPWALAVLLPLLLLARWLQRRWRPQPVSALLKLPLALLIIALTLAHYGNVFGREPGSALACGMLILKVVESERARDARAAVLFGAFVLMSALLFAQSLLFTAFLTMVLILLLAVLRQLQVGAENEARTWRPQFNLYLRDASLSLLYGAPLALCAFLLIPRLNSPLWGAPNDGDSARTGLSEHMAPGDIANLIADDSPAFRVGFAQPPPPEALRYWRGPVLWNFDGRSWTRPQWADSQPSRAILNPTSALLDYDITQEPNSQRWMLALDMPMQIPEDAIRTNDLSIITQQRDSTNPRHYHLRSAIEYVLEPELSPNERQRALQLPVGFNPRTLMLAQQLRTTHGNEDIALVSAALARFREDYTYTLAPPLLGRDSIDEFLFDTRAGFCEHYASSFTYLMRAAGIPARVVTGYQGGYFNNVGNYLLVRQSDAHAWSEVWLAQRGWVRIDPTAEVSPQRIELGASAVSAGSERWYAPDWLSTLRNQFDLTNRWWNEAIVQFNALRQAGMLQPFGIQHADYGQLAALLSACISVILALMTLWTLRRPRNTMDSLDRSYALLCRKLARAGVTRAAYDGPQDFSRRAQRMLPGCANVIDQLVTQYVNLRYAQTLTSDMEMRVFDREVRKLRVSKRKASSSSK